MKLIQKIIIFLYGSIFLLTILSDTTASIYNNPDESNGDGFNPIIIPGEYTRPKYQPFLFPPDAYIALSRWAATDGYINDAKQFAINALKANPANGEAVLALFDAYTRPDLYRIEAAPPIALELDVSPNTSLNTPHIVSLSPIDKAIADQLADTVQSLRPTYLPAQARIADYWLHYHRPDKALHSWHALLSQHPDTSTEIFPVLNRNLNNIHLKSSLQAYISKPPNWWKNFQQYQQKNPEP